MPTRIFTADSNASSDGKGAIERKEELLTNIAGVVTQLLPNGNLVASRTAAAARSPMCSNRVTASRRSTSCCRSKKDHAQRLNA